MTIPKGGGGAVSGAFNKKRFAVNFISCADRMATPLRPQAIDGMEKFATTQIEALARDLEAKQRELQEAREEQQRQLQSKGQELIKVVTGVCPGAAPGRGCVPPSVRVPLPVSRSGVCSICSRKVSWFWPFGGGGLRVVGELLCGSVGGFEMDWGRGSGLSRVLLFTGVIHRTYAIDHRVINV